jgi:CDP-diacylglycerol--glycerol-3-phosphate 3-phosphatidyltransferase
MKAEVIPPWKKQLPMWATYSRIVAGPILVLLLLWAHPWNGWFAAVLFILASITDWLDGFWARRYHAQSTMGQLMDPIADKILVLSAIVMLLDLDRVDPFMVFLLLSRDIFIGGLRSVAAANQVIIAAKPFGKWKTALQMTGIPCLLIGHPLFGIPLQQFGYALMWVSVLLSLISGTQYTWGYFQGRQKA